MVAVSSPARDRGLGPDHGAHRKAAAGHRLDGWIAWGAERGGVPGRAARARRPRQVLHDPSGPARGHDLAALERFRRTLRGGRAGALSALRPTSLGSFHTVSCWYG